MTSLKEGTAWCKPGGFFYLWGLDLNLDPCQHEGMFDDPEKIANASLHQRAALMADIHQLTEALLDIRELVDGYVDIDHNGQPNLAMKIQVVVETVLSRK